MPDFYYDRIVCPYCHGKGLHDGVFSHKDVHFRMNCLKFKTEEDLNDMGKPEAEIKRMPEGPVKARLLEQTARNKPFLCKSDDQYVEFWEKFGGTTEVAYGSAKKELDGMPPYELPILDPSNPEHRKALKRLRNSGDDSREDYFHYDADGMVDGVVDIFGKETFRRVCPGCHNPLPTGYGKHETKFISVIGDTSSGKTVFLSQLLKNMFTYMAYVKLTSYYTSEHENSFVDSNPVEYGIPLPRPTKASKFTQPLCYKLVQNLGGSRLKNNTIVLYDIAGENCANPEEMEKFGRFVTKSDGIILLLTPEQLGLGTMENEKVIRRVHELNSVLNTIHVAFREQKSSCEMDVPVAVCISKSDKIEELLPKAIRRMDIKPVLDPYSGERVKQFNASEYNILQEELWKRMSGGVAAPVHEALCGGYKYFNYFAFSSIGCGVEEKDGLDYPVEAPVPLRIAEPLLWLFYKFGYIGSDVPIRLPKRRELPETIMKTVKGPFFTKRTIEYRMTQEEQEQYFRSLSPEERDRYWHESRT